MYNTQRTQFPLKLLHLTAQEGKGHCQVGANRRHMRKPQQSKESNRKILIRIFSEDNSVV